MAELYSFHVAVKEMEDKIWRDIDISAKSTLAQLAYTIMVVFNTGRDHMFCLYYKGKRYELRFDPDGPKASRPNRVHLEKMKLAPGDELTMIYDYGCNWEFQITFKGTAHGAGQRKPLSSCDRRRRAWYHKGHVPGRVTGTYRKGRPNRRTATSKHV